MQHSPMQVPRPTYHGPDALTQLVIVVERLLYMLKWMADHPGDFMEGRHHDNFQRAWVELYDHLLQLDPEESKAKTTWRKKILEIAPGELRQRGLEGDQLALKLGVFNQLFEEFLDAVAKPEPPASPADSPEDAAFRERVLPWYRRLLRRKTAAARALGPATTIVSSISLIPGVSKVFEGIVEVSEIAQHVIDAFDPED